MAKIFSTQAIRTLAFRTLAVRLRALRPIYAVVDLTLFHVDIRL